MIKLILFDIDGVLIVREKLFSEVLDEEYGITLESTKDFFQGPFKEAIIGKLDMTGILPKFLKEWGYEGDVEDFLKLWFDSEAHIDEKLVGYVRGLKEQGIICVTATNQEKHRTKYLKEELGLGKVFDQFYSSSMFGIAKPDVGFFKKILKKHPYVKQREVLFIDDSLGNIVAAKKFGIHAYNYSNYSDFIEMMNSSYNL